MESPPQPLSFSDFLEKMKDPAAADLVKSIKSFIKQFEDRPSSYPANPDSDSAKVQDFMARSEQLFRVHPVWRGSLPAVLDQAVEGLEKYVMSKVWRQMFGVGQEDRDRDERYARLMRALGFVDLPTLMGVEGVAADPALLAMAQGELLKMDKYKAPRDKLLCLVNVKTMVENIVGEAAKKGAKIGGADAFFPVFLFVTIRSCLPRLASNVEYIKRFRTASRLTGQFDYMLCNLESAAMYLDTVDFRHLRISQDDFLARLAEAGLPEADVELRRLQQQRQAAAAAHAVDGALGSPRVASPRALEDYMRHHEQQLEQLGDEGQGLPGAVGSSVPESAGELAAAATTLSTPSRSPRVGTPTSAAALEQGSAAAGATGLAGGSTPGLSPVALATPSTAGNAVAGAAAAQASLAGELSLSDTLRRQLFEDGGEGAPAPVVAVHATAGPVAHAATGAVSAAALAEPWYVEEMVGEGAQYVLEAEARGQLQHKYPFMYADTADLTLGDVERVLAGYKALAMRYEALVLMLRRQLGSTVPATQQAALYPQHPAQQLQQAAVAAAAPRGRGTSEDSGLALSESGSSPTNRRSLLQRITSRGRGQASPADTLQRSSPTGATQQAPAAGRWRGVEGSATTLLSRLFESPNRQASRKGQEAAMAAAAGAGGTPAIVMAPLPTAAAPAGAVSSQPAAAAPAAKQTLAVPSSQLAAPKGQPVAPPLQAAPMSLALAAAVAAEPDLLALEPSSDAAPAVAGGEQRPGITELAPEAQQQQQQQQQAFGSLSAEEAAQAAAVGLDEEASSALEPPETESDVGQADVEALLAAAEDSEDAQPPLQPGTGEALLQGASNGGLASPSGASQGAADEGAPWEGLQLAGEAAPADPAAATASSPPGAQQAWQAAGESLI